MQTAFARWVGYLWRLAIHALRFFFNHPGVLSYSKISSYLTCPLKFRYEGRGRATSRRPGPTLMFGTTIHKALELFHDEFHDPSKATPDDMMKILERVWPSSHGFKNADEHARYKTRARELLGKYLTEAGTHPAKVWKTEANVSGVIAGARLTGRMDRIDIEPDGSYTIIDYKTGENPGTGGGGEEDLQANIYYMLGEKSLGRKFRNFQFWYLEQGVKVPVRLTDAARRDTERIIRCAAHGMQFDDSEPVRGALCSWCDHYERCPAWKGRSTNRLYKQVRYTEGRMGLSHSKMNLYENCPFAYRKLYLDKVTSKPKWFFSIGHTIHEVMEEFYQYRGPRAEPPLSWMLKLLDKHWHCVGYESREQERTTREEARQWLRKYHDKYARGKFRPAMAVEEYFEIPLGDHAVIGFIDRLEKNDDGTVSLYDYKTDPVMRTQAEVDADPQLILYAWACRKLGIPLRDQTLLFMRFNEHITTRTADADIARCEEHLMKAAEKMAAAEKRYKWIPEEEATARFPAKINKYCGGCDHLSVCPKREEILAHHQDKLMHKIDDAIFEGAGG